MSQRDRARRVHVCMKHPCSYCAARSNAQHPPDVVDGYTDLISAVATELRRRAVRAPERPAARRRTRRD